MVSESQQGPVHEIENALMALRLGQGRHGPGPRGMRGRGGPPWGDGKPPWGDGPPPWAGGPGGAGHDHRERGLGGGARIRLLDVLAGAGPDARNGISEIAEAVGVDQPRASRLVNDAAMRGLVTRGVDERDARRSVVAITEAGRALLQTTRASRHSAVTDALAGFTPEEATQFAALLTRFAAAFPGPPRREDTNR